MLIAIIAAMDEEIAPLKAQLNNCSTEVTGAFEFYRGELCNKEIVLLKSGIGKVNAAISTTLLLKLFKPDYVINTGSAGGVDSSLNVGDIIVSHKVSYHDVDLTAFNYEPGQLPGLPTCFIPDNKLVAATMTHLDQLQDVTHRSGLIASGDRFIHDKQDINKIKTRFPEIMACDMEAAAVAQTCYQLKTPFVIIRAISDIPGRENAIEFKMFLERAAENYTQFLLSMLKDM